jgi:hypothetical protein
LAVPGSLGLLSFPIPSAAATWSLSDQ